MFMKTFEEKWTAWVDDELNEAERAEFEASLDDRVAAEAEKQRTLNLAPCSRKSCSPARWGTRNSFTTNCAIASRRK